MRLGFTAAWNSAPKAILMKPSIIAWLVKSVRCDSCLLLMSAFSARTGELTVIMTATKPATARVAAEHLAAETLAPTTAAKPLTRDVVATA
jgi:hypothetical protein